MDSAQFAEFNRKLFYKDSVPVDTFVQPTISEDELITPLEL